VNRDRLSWGASLGAIAGYVLGVFTSYPIRLVYSPRLDAWSAREMPGVHAIHWYGWVLDAALGAVVGMAVTWPLRRSVRWPVAWLLAFGALAALVYHERGWFQR